MSLSGKGLLRRLLSAMSSNQGADIPDLTGHEGTYSMSPEKRDKQGL